MVAESLWLKLRNMVCPNTRQDRTVAIRACTQVYTDNTGRVVVTPVNKCINTFLKYLRPLMDNEVPLLSYANVLIQNICSSDVEEPGGSTVPRPF